VAPIACGSFCAHILLWEQMSTTKKRNLNRFICYILVKVSRKNKLPYTLLRVQP
jgi:hypothetical protein